MVLIAEQTTAINRKTDHRASAPLEFVHSDFSVAADPIARDGFKYAITFVDDYSSAIFVYFLKLKSDATKALRKFLADSAPYGKVKKIRTDNGGEYLAQQFEAITIENQIKLEHSSPHSPHQNGTAERNWRTLFDMGRTLLIESKLPKIFWTYAIMASAFIRNRCFTQRTKEIPFSLC